MAHEPAIHATGNPVSADGNTLRHSALVTLAISGQNTGLVARIGDWTWDFAHRMCGVDPYRAVNVAGEPSYLSFCYIRLLGTGEVHTRSFGLGARIDVESSGYQVGPGALYVAHRISAHNSLAEPLDLDALRGGSLPDSLYAETYNRWVSRAFGGSNERLVKAAPPGFNAEGLPRLPAIRHPRAALRRARADGSFATGGNFEPAHASDTFRYEVDVTSDINAVDLVYYSSYFGVVDRALLDAWLATGRTRKTFLARHVLEHEIAFFGNADYTSALRVRQTLRRQSDRWVFDAVITRGSDGECIAVATLRFREG